MGSTLHVAFSLQGYSSAFLSCSVKRELWRMRYNMDKHVFLSGMNQYLYSTPKPVNYCVLFPICQNIKSKALSQQRIFIFPRMETLLHRLLFCFANQSNFQIVFISIDIIFKFMVKYDQCSCQGDGTRELLTDFVILLPVGQSARLQFVPFTLALLFHVRSIPGECQMGVPAEDTLTLQLAKSIIRPSVFRVYSLMTYHVIGMCAIYIILIDLSYWTGLVEWIVLRGVLSSS